MSKLPSLRLLRRRAPASPPLQTPPRALRRGQFRVPAFRGQIRQVLALAAISSRAQIAGAAALAPHQERLALRTGWILIYETLLSLVRLGASFSTSD